MLTVTQLFYNWQEGIGTHGPTPDKQQLTTLQADALLVYTRAASLCKYACCTYTHTSQTRLQNAANECVLAYEGLHSHTGPSLPDGIVRRVYH